MKNLYSLFLIPLIGCQAINPSASHIKFKGNKEKVEFSISLPKDLKGKAFIIEGFTDVENLESTSSFLTETTDPSNKDFQGFRFVVTDFTDINNPEVVKLISDLNKAKIEGDTEKIKSISTSLIDVLTKIVIPN